MVSGIMVPRSLLIAAQLINVLGKLEKIRASTGGFRHLEEEPQLHPPPVLQVVVFSQLYV